MSSLEYIGFGKMFIGYESHMYPVTGFKISQLFRSRVDEGLHDDVALIFFSGFEANDYYEIAEHAADQYIMPGERQAGESGSPLLDADGKICGVLSRSKLGKSIYSGTTIKLFGS